MLRHIHAILNKMKTVTRADGLKRSVEISAICVILCTPAAIFLIGEHSAPLKVAIGLVGVGVSLLAIWACRRNRPRLGLVALIPGAVATFTILLWFGALVVTVTSHRLAWLMVSIDLLVLMGLWRQRHKSGWSLILAAPMIWTATHVIFASCCFLYLTFPADREYCEALGEQPGVTWFSEAIDPFFAADVQVLPNGQYIAATSKIWHDGYLAPIFAGHKEHKVVIMTASKGAETAGKITTAQLPWRKMPQFLLADSKGNLVVTLIDHEGHHALGVIRDPMGESPTFDDTVLLPEGILANGLVEHKEKWVAIDVRRDILWIDPTTSEVVDRWLPPAYITSFGPEMMMDFEVADDHTLYLSTLGSRIFALDLDSQSGRNSEAFGGPGSSVDWVPEHKTLVGGDVLKYRIRLINSEDLSLITEKEVSYPVRPVRAAPDINIVVAGDYIDGMVHAYKLQNLEPVGEPVGVGGNIRRIIYDPGEGAYYTASKCGVFKIDPHAAFLR